MMSACVSGVPILSTHRPTDDVSLCVRGANIVNTQADKPYSSAFDIRAGNIESFWLHNHVQFVFVAFSI